MDKDSDSGENGLVRLRIDAKTEILVKPENATREYARAYKKRLLKRGARMRTYKAEIVEILGYMRSIDFRFGSYEDLERMEDLSERIKMGIDKE
jgi:hypothetical protein